MDFFNHAEQRLYDYFKDGRWEIYDGAVVAQDSILTATDITISVALNSRVDTRDKVWHIWKHKENINQALSKIPTDLVLTDSAIPWDDLEDLFKTFCQAKYAKGAVATKILHKKRPALIPIYDRMIGEFFRKNQLLSDSQWWQQWPQVLIAYMQEFRTILQQYNAEIANLQCETRISQWPITAVRTLEVLIWIHQDKLNKQQ